MCPHGCVVSLKCLSLLTQIVNVALFEKHAVLATCLELCLSLSKNGQTIRAVQVMSLYPRPQTSTAICELVLITSDMSILLVSLSISRFLAVWQTFQFTTLVYPIQLVYGPAVC